MKKLETNILGLKMQNPVMNASGTFDLDYRRYFDLSTMGALVTKGVSPELRRGNLGVRVAETPSGMLNSIGLEGAGIDYFMTMQLPKWSEFGPPVIVNFDAADPEGYGLMAAQLDEDPRVAALEINVSCPNVRDGKMAFGTNPDAVADVVENVRRGTRKPIVVKLTPNVASIAVIARAAENAGADAISLINTLKAMVIDIKTMRPLLGNKTGGLSGPAVRPVAVSMVYECAAAVKIPIIGMGGIECADDALQFMMAGASAVAVGSAGFGNKRAIPSVIEGLVKYAAVNKLGNISEIVGAAHMEKTK
jgi:dihydroorotate dehydrogenase (NAD+) catalytic subunit